MGEKPRRPIAFFLPSMSGGGAERVALTVIEQFLSEGHDVDLLLLQRTGELLASLPPSLRIVDLDAPRIRDAIIPLIRYMRREKPIAVQASMWPLTVVAILARMVSRVRTRIVVSDHGILSEHYGGSNIVKATLRAFYRFADARIVVSQGLARDAATLSGLDAEKFVVIYNPIPFPDNFDDLAPMSDAWGNAEIRLLNVGSLKAEKDQLLLVDAFAHFVERHPNAALVIIGEGELRERIAALAKAKGIQDRVKLIGYIDDPWPYYAAATMFVLTSQQEGLGNVLIEALYAGLPIVSTNCPAGPREILQDGEYGMLVDDRDPVALAAAIEGTLIRPTDPVKLRGRAIEISGPASLNLYRSVILGS